MTTGRYDDYWQNPAAHTLAKTVILREYLGGWFAKLGQTMPRIAYLDGFAGRGIYGTGDPGSPLVALDVASTHTGRLADCDIQMYFIERSAANAAVLQGEVDKRQAAGQIPGNISTQIVHGTFGAEILKLIEYLEEEQTNLAPSFVMIDPFGWTDFGMDLIHRLSKLGPRSEVFVTFMALAISRAAPQDSPAHMEELDRLFGGRDHWIGVRNQPNAETRRSFMLTQYIGQLRAGGYRYVYSFEMRNDRNVPEYYLVFATKNLDGLALMKQAMWKADPTGEFGFSDYIDNQRRVKPILFGATVDYFDLKRRLVDRFKGVPAVDVQTTLREFVLEETPYLDTHYKRQILAPMEKAKEIEVVASVRKSASGYPDPTSIRFS